MTFKFHADGCPMEQGPSYLPYFPEFRIYWPESEIGQTVTESCACGSFKTTYLGNRTCGGDYSNGAVWRTQDVSLCSFSNATVQLCQTSEVSKLSCSHSVPFITHLHDFSFFALYSLLLLSFFLYLKSVPIYVIVHDHAFVILVRVG